MEEKLGAAARFRRMESGLEEALASLREKDNGKAERILTELINYESEESNGI